MKTYKFGDILKYTSPYCPSLESPCVFIRDDGGLAVILFRNAEWVARVNYLFLSKSEGD